MRHVLQAIQHRPQFEKETAVIVFEYFHETLFKPVSDLLDQYGITANFTQRDNTQVDPLFVALQSGVVDYEKGEFIGKFNAAISNRLEAIGATWRPDKRTFRLQSDRIPYDLRAIISARQSKTKEAIAALIALILLLGSNAEEAETGMTFGRVIDKVSADLQKQFAGIVGGIKGLTVPTVPIGATLEWAAQLKFRIDALAKAYLKRSLAVLLARLRAIAAKARPSSYDLITLLLRVGGIFRRYAERLGRNEIGHGTADRVEEFAKKIGSQSYVWLTMRDWRVRPTPDYPLGDHRVLEGTSQLWSSPPVTIPGTGHTAHPGQDIECRCRARIVINLPT